MTHATLIVDPSPSRGCVRVLPRLAWLAVAASIGIAIAFAAFTLVGYVDALSDRAVVVAVPVVDADAWVLWAAPDGLPSRSARAFDAASRP